MTNKVEYTYRRELARYMVADEKIMFAQREHWVAVAAFTTAMALGWGIAGLLLIGYLAGGSNALLLVAALFFAGGTWGWWRWFDWRRNIFIATNKRLLRTYGVITRKVAMMPLGKVTDMNYQRSPIAMVLGYGTFRVESAGQVQALETIRWVRDPDHTYRQLIAEIFAPAARRATDVRPPPGSGSRLPVVEPDDVWWRR